MSRAFICFFAISLFLSSKLAGQTTVVNEISPKPIVLIYTDATNTVYFVSTGQEYLGLDLTSTIYDLSGRMMSENILKGGTAYGIFVGNFSTGIYFVQVRNENELIGNQKIIIQQK